MAKDLFRRIDEIIEKRSLLKHPLYEAWSMGTLPVRSLRTYARQYYHFESAYPTFLSGFHYRCADPEVWRLLLERTLLTPLAPEARRPDESPLVSPSSVLRGEFYWW